MPAFTEEESRFPLLLRASQWFSEAKRSRAREMAQQMKGLAARSDDLISVPTISMVEGEDQFLQVVICLPHPCCDV